MSAQAAPQMSGVSVRISTFLYIDHSSAQAAHKLSGASFGLCYVSCCSLIFLLTSYFPCHYLHIVQVNIHAVGSTYSLSTSRDSILMYMWISAGPLSLSVSLVRFIPSFSVQATIPNCLVPVLDYSMSHVVVNF